LNQMDSIKNHTVYVEILKYVYGNSLHLLCVSAQLARSQTHKQVCHVRNNLSGTTKGSEQNVQNSRIAVGPPETR
jgi:hypothetical protein